MENQNEAANLSSETLHGHKIVDPSQELTAELEAARKTPEYAAEMANLSSEDAEKAFSVYIERGLPIFTRTDITARHAFLAGRASQAEENAKLRQEIERLKQELIRAYTPETRDDHAL